MAELYAYRCAGGPYDGQMIVPNGQYTNGYDVACITTLRSEDGAVVRLEGGYRITTTLSGEPILKWKGWSDIREDIR